MSTRRRPPSSKKPQPPSSKQPPSSSGEEDDMMMRVKVGGYSTDEDITVEVKAAEKVETLRVKLGKLGINKNPPKYFFFNTAAGVLNEELSFRDQNIADGDHILVILHEYLESVRSAFKKRSSPTVRNDEDDIKMRVTVRHGDATTTEEVWSGQKVDRLRVKLGKKKGFILPERYSFKHKGNMLKKDLSFIDQNVADGDDIEIVH